MSTHDQLPRRQMLLASAAAVGGPALATAGAGPGAGAADPHESDKVLRIGVISATIRGKPQTRNGHTWHFAQYLHPTADIDAYCKFVDPGSAKFFREYMRNPKFTFDQLPFPDTKITHYYDVDTQAATDFTQAFPGVEVANSIEEMVEQVDAIWLGDASGFGDDHFDLVAPGLKKACRPSATNRSAKLPPVPAKSWSSPHNTTPRLCLQASSGTSGVRRLRCVNGTLASSGRFNT